MRHSSLTALAIAALTSLLFACAAEPASEETGTTRDGLCGGDEQTGPWGRLRGKCVPAEPVDPVDPIDPGTDVDSGVAVVEAGPAEDGGADAATASDGGSDSGAGGEQCFTNGGGALGSGGRTNDEIMSTTLTLAHFSCMVGAPPGTVCTQRGPLNCLFGEWIRSCNATFCRN